MNVCFRAKTKPLICHRCLYILTYSLDRQWQNSENLSSCYLHFILYTINNDATASFEKNAHIIQTLFDIGEKIMEISETKAESEMENMSRDLFFT